MFLIFAFFVCMVHCDVKIWKYDTLISNKENLIQGYEHRCSGLIFPENLGAPTVLENVTVSDVVLPNYGRIYFRNNMRIVLSDTSRNCIKVKQLEYKSWLNPRNWQFEGLNNAVPHTNRVPCKDDEVFIRTYPAFAIQYPKIEVQIQKITIQNYNLTHDELQEFLDSSRGYYLFQNNQLQMRREIIKLKDDLDCYNKYGCTCQENYRLLNTYVCDELKKDLNYRKTNKCYAPIEIIGHCEPFCGAAVIMRISREFNINFIKNILSNLPNIDSHISRVQSENGTQFVQIVLTDSGEYNADSIDVAENFFKKYIDGQSEHGIKNAIFFKSDAPYHPESQLNTVKWIVLGTLFACLFIFSTIFVLNSDKAQEYKPLIRKLKQRSKSSVKSMREQIQPFRFARFENRDDGNLNLAGSIISLDKSFVNPLFSASGSKTTDTEFIKETEVAEELSDISEGNINSDEHKNLMSTAMENLAENIDKIEKLIE